MRRLGLQTQPNSPVHHEQVSTKAHLRARIELRPTWNGLKARAARSNEEADGDRGTLGHECSLRVYLHTSWVSGPTRVDLLLLAATVTFAGAILPPEAFTPEEGQSPSVTLIHSFKF